VIEAGFFEGPAGEGYIGGIVFNEEYIDMPRNRGKTSGFESARGHFVDTFPL
jgi:hypothetical protein